MERFEKRYLEVDGHLVEFYFWGDEITPAIRVSVVEKARGWFKTRYRILYSESHRRDKITSYSLAASNVVANYKLEMHKLEAFKK